MGFAGLKDKNARTTQTFSLHVGMQDPAYAQEAAGRIVEQLGLQVDWARFHRNKLRTGHLLGNRFAIVVSEPNYGVDECLARCRDIAGVVE